jgi:hypothetical protein
MFFSSLALLHFLKFVARSIKKRKLPEYSGLCPSSSAMRKKKAKRYIYLLRFKDYGGSHFDPIRNLKHPYLIPAFLFLLCL